MVDNFKTSDMSTEIIQEQEIIGISELVLNFVNSSGNNGNEVTILAVSRHFDLNSGTYLILKELTKKGLIRERIERNGTSKFSSI